MKYALLVCSIFVVYCFAQVKPNKIITVEAAADTVTVSKSVVKVYVPPVPAGSTFVAVSDRFTDAVPPGFEVEVEYKIGNEDTILRYYKMTQENATNDTLTSIQNQRLFKKQ